MLDEQNKHCQRDVRIGSSEHAFGGNHRWPKPESQTVAAVVGGGGEQTVASSSAGADTARTLSSFRAQSLPKIREKEKNIITSAVSHSIFNDPFSIFFSFHLLLGIHRIFVVQKCQMLMMLLLIVRNSANHRIVLMHYQSIRRTFKKYLCHFTDSFHSFIPFIQLPPPPIPIISRIPSTSTAAGGEY